MIESGKTQTEVAEELKVSLAYVNRITKGWEPIVNKTFVRMMDELGYDVELTYKKSRCRRPRMKKSLFDPGLEIGQIIKNDDLVETFKCGNMGGMRRSKATNTLVIVSDYTKGIYHDKWIGGVLHYTGMGKSGDQDIHWAQNATLAESDNNGVDVHLFEVMDAGEYVYCGRIELVKHPYTETQPGEDGNDRKVWMFPIRPVPDNDVQKPEMFVFPDMEDYRARGKNVDLEYTRIMAERKKKQGQRTHQPAPTPAPVSQPEPKPVIVVPPEIRGKTVKHKAFGTGKITGMSDTIIEVDFDKVGIKKMGYEFCIKNNMLEFID